MKKKIGPVLWPAIAVASLVANFQLSRALATSWDNERRLSANLENVRAMLNLERTHVKKLVGQIKGAGL